MTSRERLLETLAEVERLRAIAEFWRVESERSGAGDKDRLFLVDRATLARLWEEWDGSNSYHGRLETRIPMIVLAHARRS